MTAEPHIFVGYDDTSSEGYVCFNLSKQTFVTRKTVSFDERWRLRHLASGNLQSYSDSPLLTDYKDLLLPRTHLPPPTNMPAPDPKPPTATPTLLTSPTLPTKPLTTTPTAPPTAPPTPTAVTDSPSCVTTQTVRATDKHAKEYIRARMRKVDGMCFDDVKGMKYLKGDKEHRYTAADFKYDMRLPH